MSMFVKTVLIGFKLLDEIALNFCQENEYIQESLLGN